MAKNVIAVDSERIVELTQILDEFTGWFMAVLQKLFYGEEPDVRQLREPVSFMNWCNKVTRDGVADEAFSNVQKLHSDLLAQAVKLQKLAKNGTRIPDKNEFSSFLLFFEEFSLHIRRLEKDFLLENSGIDALTGLRMRSAFFGDLRRELDRVARQGKPVCVALVRIGEIKKYKRHNEHKLAEMSLAFVAKVVRRCVRSFDDVYAWSEDELVLVLKQTDVTGAVRALERLKRELESKEPQFVYGGKDVPLNLVSCIAQPVPGEDIDILMGNLSSDLDGFSSEDGLVLTYNEISPLQRFLKHFTKIS